MDLSAGLSSLSTRVIDLLSRPVPDRLPTSTLPPSLQTQVRMPVDQVAGLCQQYEAGVTVRQLSRSFGIHHDTVYWRAAGFSLARR